MKNLDTNLRMFEYENIFCGFIFTVIIVVVIMRLLDVTALNKKKKIFIIIEKIVSVITLTKCF